MHSKNFKFYSIILIAFTVLLYLVVPLAAEPLSRPTHKQETFNYGILQTDKDAEIFLNILTQMHEGNQQKVIAFMEYQLDEIVCGLWSKMDQMNDAQKRISMKRLKAIKEYRQQHPGETRQVNTKEFSRYIPEQDQEISTSANDILDDL